MAVLAARTGRDDPSQFRPRLAEGASEYLRLDSLSLSPSLCSPHLRSSYSPAMAAPLYTAAQPPAYYDTHCMTDVLIPSPPLFARFPKSYHEPEVPSHGLFTLDVSRSSLAAVDLILRDVRNLRPQVKADDGVVSAYPAAIGWKLFMSRKRASTAHDRRIVVEQRTRRGESASATLFLQHCRTGSETWSICDVGFFSLIHALCPPRLGSVACFATSQSTITWKWHRCPADRLFARFSQLAPRFPTQSCWHEIDERQMDV